MSDGPTDPAPTDPPEDPTAAELARLRKEAADRAKADQDAKDAKHAETAAELEKLRKADADRQAADAKKPQPPDKKPATEPQAATETKTSSHGASTKWFGK